MQPSPAQSEPFAWRLKPDSLGPIKVGMPLDRVNAAIGGGMRVVPAELRPSPDCYIVSTESTPSVSYMFVAGVLKRIDVRQAGIRSDHGIAVGDPVAKVWRAYGRSVRAETDAYDPREQYLTVPSRDGRFGIRYETANGKVKSYYGGAWEQVQYTEGCL
jgi:hypothetical protein